MFCAIAIKPTTFTQRDYNILAFNKVNNDTVNWLMLLIKPTYFLLYIWPISMG